MNSEVKNCPIRKCFIPSLAVFFFMVAYDVALNTFVMADMYKETASIWRPEAEMKNYILWLMLHTGILAVIITLIYDKSSENRSAFCVTGTVQKPECPLSHGLCFGLIIGMFMGIMDSRAYAWLPIPLDMALAWFFSGIFEGVCIGLLLSKVRRKRIELQKP